NKIFSREKANQTVTATFWWITRKSTLRFELE
ncbi:hypothetical protein scyTo_0015329, partial [Scyliorhinus torazame]|nr:hypothetical protein [Scyliorhinus torazame]